MECAGRTGCACGEFRTRGPVRVRRTLPRAASRRLGDGGGPPARLLALSDGIYAIAMTLLVLDLSSPRGWTRPSSAVNSTR
ncbi:TMEM175 family protein [Actinomadura keratinilytica]